MSGDVFLIKTPSNQEADLLQIVDTVPLPCWRELRQMLYSHFPDLRSGYARLDDGIHFPVLSSPDYALEFNLAAENEDEPLTVIMFNCLGVGNRWAYPLKFLCGLLDARIVDCGSFEFWDWNHLPDWIAEGL